MILKIKLKPDTNIPYFVSIFHRRPGVEDIVPTADENIYKVKLNSTLAKQVMKEMQRNQDIEYIEFVESK